MFKMQGLQFYVYKHIRTELDDGFNKIVHTTDSQVLALTDRYAASAIRDGLHGNAKGENIEFQLSEDMTLIVMPYTVEDSIWRRIKNRIAWVMRSKTVNPLISQVYSGPTVNPNRPREVVKTKHAPDSL